MNKKPLQSVMTRAHSVIIIISLEGSLGDGGMEGEKKKRGKEGGWGQ